MWFCVPHISRGECQDRANHHNGKKKAGGVNAFCSGQCFFSFHFLVFLLDIELRIISLFFSFSISFFIFVDFQMTLFDRCPKLPEVVR